MRFVSELTAIFSVSILTIATTASAQDPVAQPAAPQATPTVQPEAPPPVAPSAAAPQTPAPAANPPQEPQVVESCALGPHHGVKKTESLVTQQIVCDELRTQGASPSDRFLVDVFRLGSSVTLSVTRLDAQGNPGDRRALRLKGIEEVHIATPRIVSALLKNAPLAETERVDNLVGEETRLAPMKKGRMSVGGGVIGTLVGSEFAPGLALSLYFKTPQYAVGGQLSGGGSSDSDDSESSNRGFGSIDVGGRYYLSLNDVSPFVGGGFGLTTIASDSYSGSGLAPFAEFGIEALRTYKAHLNFSVRAYVPTYELSNGSSQRYDYEYGYQTEPEKKDSKYVLPLTFNATVSF